jgi:hypothetical protein
MKNNIPVAKRTKYPDHLLADSCCFVAMAVKVFGRVVIVRVVVVLLTRRPP